MFVNNGSQIHYKPYFFRSLSFLGEGGCTKRIFAILSNVDGSLASLSRLVCFHCSFVLDSCFLIRLLFHFLSLSLSLSISLQFLFSLLSIFFICVWCARTFGSIHQRLFFITFSQFLWSFFLFEWKDFVLVRQGRKKKQNKKCYFGCSLVRSFVRWWRTTASFPANSWSSFWSSFFCNYFFPPCLQDALTFWTFFNDEEKIFRMQFFYSRGDTRV